MSYAIIRNSNYKINNLSGIYRHNERKNSNYSNKDINRQNSTKNYSIKAPYFTYEKIFKDMRKNRNLKGQIKKVSNVMCELIITSDKGFFDSIGEEETKRYFQTAYEFVSKYQNLGEENIVSAKVHMDESTPHLHLVYVPVVHKYDKKSGNTIDKISCSEYWKGKDSYKKLQDKFYEYVTKAGFELERGRTRDVKHLSTEEFKKVTEYENIKKELENDKVEVVKTSNLPMVIEQNKSLVVQNNKLKMYLRKSLKAIEKSIMLERKNAELKEDNQYLENENRNLKNYIEHSLECVSILFDFSKDSLKRILDRYHDGLISKFKGKDK